MARRKDPQPAKESEINLASLLSALAKPTFVINHDNRFLYANPAAEDFFNLSGPLLQRRRLEDVLSPDSPLISLVQQARAEASGFYEHDVELAGPRILARAFAVEVAPLPEQPQSIVVCLEERGLARRLEQQAIRRSRGFSMTALSAMLAHEVKNPLAGIRGAAQLLEASVGSKDKALAQLICEECDRITALLERMESFTGEGPIKLGPVNIHEVVSYVRRLIVNEFAYPIAFIEDYDPSLPNVLGQRDLLIQIVLNLMKNAAEALSDTGGARITLRTRYRHGSRLSSARGASQLERALVLEIEDNGPGIPEELRAHLFEPFVSSKGRGRGFGLPLAAKLVDDQGGVIDFESEAGHTVFRLLLPLCEEELS